MLCCHLILPLDFAALIKETGDFKSFLYPCPHPRKPPVPLPLPPRKGGVPLGPVHDPTVYPKCPQGMSPGFHPVALVGKDRLLIPLDHLIKHTGIVDIGRGHLHLPYELALMVKGDVGLITVKRLLAPDRVGCIRVPGRTALCRRPPCGFNKGGIYNGALLQQKPLLLKLIGDEPEELLGKANLAELDPEAAYGGFIRYRIFNVETEESEERDPVPMDSSS